MRWHLQFTDHSCLFAGQIPELPPYLDGYSAVVALWHPTRNGALQPKDVSRSGKRRVWLQCPGCTQVVDGQVCAQVHEWDARPDNLTEVGHVVQCPTCKPGRGGSKFCRCRTVGALAAMAAAWADHTDPFTVPRSRTLEKYWWRCLEDKGHGLYKASPHHMEKKPRCPQCGNESRRAWHMFSSQIPQ